MKLLEVQRSFRDWLTAESDEAAARLGRAAAPGLAVHLNTYRGQLLSCLGETFGVVRAWLGETAFAAAAATHIDRVPPSSWTLDAYARDFPDTLSALYAADPEVGDLARLERVLADVFVATDCTPVTPGSVDQGEWERIDWDRAVLHLVPGFALLPVTTNAAAIWSALSNSRPPPPAASLETPAQLALWRNGFTPSLRTLDPAEAAALEQIAGGCTFGALCALMIERCGAVEGSQLAGGWLGLWLRDGLIARVS
jgi:Putative DNA-binding domain